MAASPRPPSWAIGRTESSAGVLGETAPAVAGRRRALGFEVRSPDAKRKEPYYAPNPLCGGATKGWKLDVFGVGVVFDGVA